MPEKYDRLAKSSNTSNAKKGEEMATLRAMVRYWIELVGLKLEWLPRSHLERHEQADPSMVDFGHRYIMNGHRISEFYLVSLINAYMMINGYGFRYKEVGIFLREWVTETFAHDVSPAIAAVIANRPRITTKRKRGRPRRDGTSYDIVIENGVQEVLKVTAK